MNYKNFIELETDRLILKSLDKSYSKNILNYLIRNKEFFSPWSPKFSEEFYSLETQERILDEKLNLLSEEKEIKLFILKKDNIKEIIGDLSFSNIIKGNFLSCNLGYKLDKDNTSKGYMNEALKKSIEFIFDNLHLHRIEANVMPKNESSIKLLNKLGFINEGLSKKYLKINDKWEDHLRFILLNESFE